MIATGFDPETELGYRSRLLSSLLLIVIAIGILGEIEWLIQKGGFGLSDGLVFITILLMAAFYLINRRGYFRTAVILTIGIMVLSIYAMFWLGDRSRSVIEFLAYLVVPIVMAEFFLSSRAYAVVVILILSGMLGSLQFPTVGNRFIFLAGFSALLGVSTYHRGKLEQKRQARLEEAEQKYRTLVEKVPAITYAREASRDGLTQYVSPQIETILAISSEQWKSSSIRSWLDLIHPNDREGVAMRFDLLVETGQPFDVEYRVNTPNGRLVWFHDQAVMLRDAADNPASIQGVIYDVTDRKQVEEELRTLNEELERRVAERTEQLNQTNAELEHANRAKDEFLANMSHELRTPLNSILGLSETLLEQRGGSLNERQQRSLQTIEFSGRHLLELINDILDLSKIEAGKFDYYPQAISVDEICRSSMVFVKTQASKKSITVAYINETSISKIDADPRRLKQILVNLLTNAIKFTPDHGHVTLQVLADAEQERIQLSVIDSGIGIALEDLKKLFTPFTQVESSLDREYEGTGLGLALVKKLTDLHGGSVDVESEVGKGSRFTINLPAGKTMVPQQEVIGSGDKLLSNEQKETSSISSRERLDHGTILLAEDNVANILTIGEYLESHGYQVLFAHDGFEAIEYAEKRQPDLILMDIQMPAMDGLEAIRRLRADPRFISTPIIALTALAMPGDRERCLEAGATEYMSKPVSLKMLVKTIRQLLNQEEQNT